MADDQAAAGPQYAKKWVKSAKKKYYVRNKSSDHIWTLCSKWLNISLISRGDIFENILTFEGMIFC